MRIRAERIVSKTIPLLFLLVVFAGCAETNVRVKDESPFSMSGMAVIQSVEVTGDAYQVEINADKPLAYTFYKNVEPLKAVIDLAQAQPGDLAPQKSVNSGIVKDITIARHEIGGTIFTRIEIGMASNDTFTVTPDPVNKGKLLVAFQKNQAGGDGAKAQEAKAADTAESVKVEPETVKVEVVKDRKEPAEASSSDTAAAMSMSERKRRGLGMAAADTGAQAVESAAKSTDTADDSAKSAVKNGQKVLTAVNVVKDGVELEVSGGVERFSSFPLASPRRLVVDLFSIKSGIGAKVVPVNSFGIGKARIGLAPDKVRIVFDSLGTTLPAYDVSKTDKGVKIVFGEGAALSTAKESQESSKSTPAPEPKKTAKGGAGSVEAIDFKMIDGYSRIAIKVNGNCTVDKPVKVAEGQSLTIKNCQIPRHLQRMVDTSAFSSVVKGITPYQIRMKKGYNARLLAKLRSDASNTINQDGDTINWDFKNPPRQESSARPAEVVRPQPAAAVERPVRSELARIEGAKSAEAPVKAAPETDKRTIVAPRSSTKKVYTGRRVSLEFSDADIRKIFQLIAEVSNYNFIIADDVSGTISLKLINVPWDQALDVIMESKNLEKKQEGNIVYIKPKGKFRTQEQEDADARRAREKMMELKTQVFEVNFASLADVATQFKMMASDRGRDSIIQDSRTNKIIVKDIEPKLLEMEELLKKLDSPEKQVMIEARIVEATSTFTRDLGVQWGIHYKDGSASFLGINQLDTGFGGIVSAVPPPAGFQAPDTSGGSMGLSFGKLTSNIQVDMRLSAAATAGLIKIISTPKVITLNNKAAKISQGQMVPYSTISAEGTRTAFIEAALTLEVTPHITPDGNIGMKIKASNNSVGAAPVGVAPPLNIKEATTELQVKNGETTVIGGIYVDSDTENDSGVPFLMDIPLLGWMFKSNTKSKTKTELLIFITPKVVI